METKKKKGKWKKWLLGILFLILLAVGINIYQNVTVRTKRYTISSSKLPKEFNQYKIVQLTDLHSVQESMVDQIVSIIEKEQPDLIVITGDLVDSTIYSQQQAAYLSGESSEIAGSEMLQMLARIQTVAPIYYIYGNHEMILLDDPEYNPFKVAVEELGVQLLNVKNTVIKKGGASINLLGIQDPYTLYRNPDYNQIYTSDERMEAMLRDVTTGIDTDAFTILLSHRPEYFDLYKQYGIDLAFTGHAHGGQFRIPLIGGVYAPNQGFFPKYDKGMYEEDQLQMIVGVGIGNSRIPVRIFDQPEVVVTTLKSEK